LNAFISLEPDRILSDARQAEADLLHGKVRGPLHGVPIAVKDNVWTKGSRTTAGSRVLADFVPGRDATVVARLRAAGAVIFGKTNLPELAYGPVDAYHYGPSRNPWDLARTTGGSSMGAAAALAGGLVPGALGTDTSGSIRNPSSWSGVVGLKPTYGMVPLRGVVPLALPLDHVGPMARSARDCALLLDVIAGHDPDDPTSAPDHRYAPSTAALGRQVPGLRVGVLRALWEPLDADVAAAVDRALDELRGLGLPLADVEVSSWDDAVEAGNVLIRCEAAAAHRRMAHEHADELLPQVRERIEAGLATPALDYIEATRVAAGLRWELRRLLARVDVLALPSRERTAPRMDDVGRPLGPPIGLRHPLPMNVAGLPSLSLPCGFDAHGLPIGLQLSARAGEDAMLLAVGHAFQQITDWHTRRPRFGSDSRTA
jgi:aspartyl-tRNA(Asn)/glutamyl-tRNA(Gln) amidotransferase subunit A